MNTVIVVSTAVSAFATIGIFLVAWLNIRMYKTLQEKHGEEQERFQDLLEAMVIATLLTGPGHRTGNYFENGKRYFRNSYKGKTLIFKEEESKTGEETSA